MARGASQRGETLIEVLVAIVLLGAISAAYFTTATTQTRLSQLNKELAQADAAARSYAELAKAAVRECSGTFTVDTSDKALFPETLTIAEPSGPVPCPSATEPRTVNLKITTRSGGVAHLSFAVLAP